MTKIRSGKGRGGKKSWEPFKERKKTGGNIKKLTQAVRWGSGAPTHFIPTTSPAPLCALVEILETALGGRSGGTRTPQEGGRRGNDLIDGNKRGPTNWMGGGVQGPPPEGRREGVRTGPSPPPQKVFSPSVPKKSASE